MDFFPLRNNEDKVHGFWAQIVSIVPLIEVDEIAKIVGKRLIDDLQVFNALFRLRFSKNN